MSNRPPQQARWESWRYSQAVAIPGPVVLVYAANITDHLEPPDV